MNDSSKTKTTKGKKTSNARRAVQYQELNNANQIAYPHQFPNQVTSMNQYMPTQFSKMNNFSNINQFANIFPPSQQYSNFSPQQFGQQSHSPQQFGQQSHSPQPFGPYHSHQSSPPNFTQLLNQPYSQFPTQDQEQSSQSPQDDDDDDVVAIPAEYRGKTKKNAFSRSEDILLAKAYVRTTDNSITGKDQKAAVYWQNITNEYNITAEQEGEKKREMKSLKNRMTRMKGEMVTFNEAIHFVDSAHHTGINEMDRMKMVQSRFVQLNTKNRNRPFAFDHVLEILNQCSKFNYTTTRSQIPRQNQSDSSPSNGSPTTPNNGGSNASTKESMQFHSGDKRSRGSTDDISSPPRPMGSKMAKRLEQEKRRKGKGKLGQMANSNEFIEHMSVERRNWYENNSEVGEKRHIEKLRLFQEVIDIEKAKVELMRDAERTKVEMKRESERARVELDRETRVMSIDVNTLTTDEERIGIAQMRA